MRDLLAWQNENAAQEREGEVEAFISNLQVASDGSISLSEVFRAALGAIAQSQSPTISREPIAKNDCQIEGKIGEQSLQPEIEAFFRRQSSEAVERVFDQHKDTATGKVPREKLVAAFVELGAPVESEDDMDAALHVLDIDGSNGVGLEQFSTILRKPHPLQQWASTLPLGPLLASCLPLGLSHIQPLRWIAAMEHAAVVKTSELFASGLQRMLGEAVGKLRASLEAMDAKAKEGSSTGQSKFATFKMSAGRVEDFYKGLQGRVGSPSLDFLHSMEAEHCRKGGCDAQFTTGNYGITTTARREWEIVMGAEEPTEEECKFGRVLHKLSELQQLPLAQEAQLKLEEVVALVLYTGPMFQVYNCVLRRFPAEQYAVFDESKNTFSTTIHVLVSAVHKISRVARLPDGLVLYCGLGGLMELPPSFWRSDERGVKGYAEWGFRSTTSDKAVAIQYSGVEQGRPLAMVLKLEVHAVDRGASIRDFSQYPREVEYLWVPCSYLEPSGPAELEVTPHGIVSTIPVRANANLITSTIEELVSQKRSMHLAAFAFLLDELQADLEALAEEGGAAARWAREKESETAKKWEKNGEKRQIPTVAEFIGGIVVQAKKVYEQQAQVSDAEYVSDEVFRALVMEMLETKLFARSKLLWWLEDSNNLITNQGVDLSYSTVTYVAESLRGAHEGYLAFLFARLRDPATSGEEKQRVALRLCKLKGLVKAAVDEEDAQHHIPFTRAAVLSSTLEELQLLAAAGADPDGRGPHEKENAMFIAARKGDAELVERLHKVGADLQKPSNGVMTPVMAAAKTGHAATIRKLAELGADVNYMPVYMRNGSALHQAMMEGHEEAVEIGRAHV